MQAQIDELTHNLELVDNTIDVYIDRLAAGTADQLWAQKSSDIASSTS